MNDNAYQSSPYRIGAQCIFNFEKWCNIQGTIVARSDTNNLCWWFIPYNQFEIPIMWDTQKFGYASAFEVHEKFLEVITDDDETQVDISDLL